MHSDNQMNDDKIINLENRYLASTYSKIPFVVAKGNGSTLWDTDGEKYIDCASGYGVALVGHCNPKVTEAIKIQSEKLLTCHCSMYNETRANLLDKLLRIAPNSMNRAFLCSSGAESVDAAIKIARKNTRRPGIIAMTGSYHGKTIGALSTTWNKRYREPFEPLLPEVTFASFGDSEQVKEKVSNKTAAILVEPVQGETGIKPAPDGFLKEIREICDENGSLLIFDEVQTGFGRTGRMWASEHWGVDPDMMCVSKSIAGGLPMGATLARDDVMQSMMIGDHSTTFGGNPLSCAAAIAVIDYILDNDLVKCAELIGTIFKNGLDELAEKYKIAREARGLGLMLALEMRFDVRNILLNALKERIVLLNSGRTILRFLPPLVISEQEIKQVLDVLNELLKKEEASKFENNGSK